MESVRILDWDKASADRVAEYVRRTGAQCEVFSSSDAALKDVPDMATFLVRHDFKDRTVEQVCATIKKTGLKADVIAYSDRPSIDAVVSAIRSGANNYVPAPFTFAKLSKALLDTSSAAHTSKASASRDDAVRRLNALTLREREILRMIASGLRNKEVGERLGISPRTVETHRANIMTKLRVQRVAELIALVAKAEG